MRYIIGISGASGGVYGARLFQKLQETGNIVELIMTPYGKEVMRMEAGIDPSVIEEIADEVYQDSDLAAPPASGSHLVDGMIICPCSMSTLSKIATGISDTLITRAAAVCLKEHRKLIIVPRETPLSSVYLRNMLTLAEAGAIILPPSPAFYHKPTSMKHLVDFIIGKILDSLGVEHDLFPRWDSKDR